MENRACDRRHDTSDKQTSPGMTHSCLEFMSSSRSFLSTEKCFLSDNIYDYFNVSQGKITVPGIDDGEESQLADVSLQNRLLPADPCRVTHTTVSPWKSLQIGNFLNISMTVSKKN